MLTAYSAQAAGALSGAAAASEAAELRAPGSSLVEIEGFAAPDGTIPCAKKSYSNSWHYKFYSGGEWLLINACGGDFIDAAKDFPQDKDAEPTKPLPASFSDSREILKKLQKAGSFKGPSESYERDMLMRAAYLKEEGGRPAGCYWTVSRGKEKIFMDCEGKKQWSDGKKPATGAITAAVKTDSAGKYSALAISTIRRKQPQAVLMEIESLVDKNGGAKCITAGEGDGWNFVFYSPETRTNSTFTACRNKTLVQEGDFTGKYKYIRDFSAIPDQFKDSSEAILKLPSSCTAGHSALLMRLHKFKPGLTPVKGHDFMWIADCGQYRYYVDAYTGKYLSGGLK